MFDLVKKMRGSAQFVLSVGSCAAGDRRVLEQVWLVNYFDAFVIDNVSLDQNSKFLGATHYYWEIIECKQIIYGLHLILGALGDLRGS